MPIQGCGGPTNRRLFGGVWFLTTLGVGVGYFIRLRLRKSKWITFASFSSPKLRIPVELVQFLMKLLLKQRILAVYHDFHWVLVATKFMVAKLFIHFVLRSRKFWKDRSWSQTFYLRPRNPGCHTWMMASISLVMVVQSNFCNRDFLIDHKFSMGLISGEFPGQSITSNFASWKSSSLFQMKDTRQYPIGIFLHHQEMPFSYLEWLFSQLHQCICINSSYLNWHKWSYNWKTETSPEHFFGFLY